MERGDKRTKVARTCQQAEPQEGQQEVLKFAPAKGGILELWAEFERCWPWLEPSISYYGHTHSKHDVWQEVLDRKAFLWPGLKSAVLVRVTRSPSGLKTLSVWTAGGNLSEIKLQIPDIEAWAKDQGCHRILFGGRSGWIRALASLGYKTHGVRLHKCLCSATKNDNNTGNGAENI